MEKIIFDCSVCSGVCCLNPPQIASKEEFYFLRENGALIKSLKVEEDKFILFVLKKNGKCPFLTNEGKCNIYENRPLACREYKCNMYGREISKEGFRSIEEFIGIFQKNTKENVFVSSKFPILFVDKKFIKKEKIKVIRNPFQILNNVFVSNIFEVVEHLRKTNLLIRRR